LLPRDLSQGTNNPLWRFEDINNLEIFGDV
jgi:hypothetical protein